MPRRQTARSLCALGLIALVALAMGQGRLDAEPAKFMMRAVVDGRLVEGQPLAWTKSQMLLLGRDGALYDFDPAKAKEAKRTAGAYAGYTSAEMAAVVGAEFGRSFETSTTAHFVVVHPHGWSQWGDRLEALYRGFMQYMGVRGFALKPSGTPLVAVVFRNSDEYHAYAAAAGSPLPPGTMGHYDPTSNRILLFDAGSAEGDADWAGNASTIVHEETHQAAYNLGVHQRFAEQSRWAVEGLAMMFEAPGVWNAASLHLQTERINRERIDHFRATSADRPVDWIVRLVESDDAFDHDPLDAYAEAWTLTFYLCETRPQEYSQYLARTAQRPLFGAYSPRERVADFTSAFGSDLVLLGAQVQRFVDALP